MTPIYSNGVNQSSGVSDGLAGTIVDAKGDLVGASAADTPARVAVGANGKVLTADSAATAGVSYQYPTPSLTAGRKSFLAWTSDPYTGPAMGGGGLSDGTLTLSALYVPAAITMTNVHWNQSTQGNFTSDNENRIGIYTSDGTDLTLVASTTDDGNLWKAAYGPASKALTTPYAASAGWYWVGKLYNSSAQTTAPSLMTGGGPNGSGWFTNAADRGAMTLAAQTTLPATVSIAATTAGSGSQLFWFAIS
jgi:hypothetical protein